MGNPVIIRDPIYGYIKLEGDAAVLINTPEFQLLRNIRQTGYQALYPSALHNRFVHSLGVYHLGCKAIQFFQENVSPLLSVSITKAWETIEQTFHLACLLHDVGHSPFSHTGEEYYVRGMNAKEEFYRLLDIPSDIEKDSDMLQSEDDLRKLHFFQDIKISKNGTGKPHEAMSAILGLKLCRRMGIALDEELFIRSIIGAKYQQGDAAHNIDKEILNAVIDLLNGELIDVDKLDYISRDSYVTGYSSLNIDLDRLLSAYTIVPFSEDTYRPAYKKGALSVIENVIYANDLERRWIQNHPSILYDEQLVGILMRDYDRTMRENTKEIATVYSEKALSVEGVHGLKRPLRLLCDDDIVSFIKNDSQSPMAEQYFSRDKRMKPLWKTEATFEHLVSQSLTDVLIKEIIDEFTSILDFIQNSGDGIIDDGLLATLQKSVEIAGETSSYARILEICMIFKSFAINEGFPVFKFMIILTNKFQSGYKKLSVKETYIELDSGLVPLEDVLSVRAKDVNANATKSLFYVYTDPQNLQGTDRSQLGMKFIEHLRKNFNRKR